MPGGTKRIVKHRVACLPRGDSIAEGHHAPDNLAEVTRNCRSHRHNYSADEAAHSVVVYLFRHDGFRN